MPSNTSKSDSLYFCLSSSMMVARSHSLGLFSPELRHLIFLSIHSPSEVFELRHADLLQFRLNAFIISRLIIHFWWSPS